MRILLLVALLTLPACSTVRGLFGEVQNAGDKGVGIQASAGNEAAEAARIRKEGDLPDLPAGLGGDTANRSYTPQN